MCYLILTDLRSIPPMRYGDGAVNIVEETLASSP